MTMPRSQGLFIEYGADLSDVKFNLTVNSTRQLNMQRCVPHIRTTLWVSMYSLCIMMQHVNKRVLLSFVLCAAGGCRGSSFSDETWKEGELILTAER
jgi:hypothetical protein